MSADKKIEAMIEKQLSKTLDEKFAQFLTPLGTNVANLQATMGTLVTNVGNIQGMLAKQKDTNIDLYAKIEALTNSLNEMKDDTTQAAKLRRGGSSPRDSGGASSSGLGGPPPVQAPPSGGKSMQYAVLVQGFGRVTMEAVRKDHWKVISKILPAELASDCEVKFPYKDKKYYIMFDCEEKVGKALEQFKNNKERLYWKDVTYGVPREVYAKRHKEVADRELNAFRRQFYLALENFFKNRIDFKDKKVSLSTIRGVMTAEIDDELYGLFTFSREFLRGTTVINVDEAVCNHLRIEVSNMEDIIQEARDAYEKEATKSS